MEIPLLLNDIRKKIGKARIERHFMRKILLVLLPILFTRSRDFQRHHCGIDQILPSKHKYLDNNKSRRMRTEEEDVEKIHSSEN